MENSDFYKEFLELEDDSDKSLRDMFVQRLASERFDSRSRKADSDITIFDPDDPENPKIGSTFQERQNSKEKEFFAWQVTSDLNEKNFATQELVRIEADLRDSKIRDYYVKQSAVAYVELLKQIIDQAEVVSLPGFEIDQKEPPWDKEKLSVIFDLMLKRRAMFSKDKENFIKVFQGRAIDKPILWFWSAGNTKRGDQQALKYFLILMFGKWDKGVIERARLIFVDKTGNPFLNTQTKYEKGGKIESLEVDQDLAEILNQNAE